MAQTLIQNIQKVISELFGAEVNVARIQLQKTRKDFNGDITLVVFPLLKISKGSPEKTGEQIGEALQKTDATVEAFNVVKGFLNISFTAAYWMEKLEGMMSVPNYGLRQKGEHSRNIMVEYSSPNTNKPLHLGHVRNNLLGYSVSEILKANGHEVQKVQIINDRGIHICKSMLAWQKWGNGETPEKSGMKGDKLVGEYYVIFGQKLKEEIEKIKGAGKSEEEAEKESELMAETRAMLLKWEANDPEIRQLWATMNGWVYKGFEVTYDRLGVDFDKLYYESETYLTGRDLVQKGLKEEVFEKHEDGSVWCDLSTDKLNPKLLLRADGTTVYMTQDLGTAKQRYIDCPELDRLIYTTGNEQDHHFKVLFLILKKLGFDWAENCFHLSYGMVELPEGIIKTREGTVVDADDLMDEMVATAKQQSEEKGKLQGMSDAEANKLFSMLGIGALKYFMLKVDPKKNMLFNPAESIDMQGNTGPFIQYTHARICSIIKKAEPKSDKLHSIENLEEKERSLVRLLSQYPETVQQAGEEYSPALIANYAFELAKEYNQFYHELPILKEEDKDKRTFRIAVSGLTANVIASAMKLLGVQVPERM